MVFPKNSLVLLRIKRCNLSSNQKRRSRFLSSRKVWIHRESHHMIHTQHARSASYISKVSINATRNGKNTTSLSNMSSNELNSAFLSQSSEGEKKEYLFKVLVIGDLGVGKTSIIKRYVHQFFSVHYRATIGVDFALKVINWDENTLIRLQLWDIAGQERFGNMTRVYYKEAVGAFIVFDVTRASTFEAVQKWKNDLDNKVTLPTGEPVPAVLLANKCDQAKEGLVNNCSQMDEYCSDKGFLGWFETSAKEGINVAEAASFLVKKILENEKAHNFEDIPKDPEAISLTATRPDTMAGAMNKQGIKPGQMEPQKSGCC